MSTLSKWSRKISKFWRKNKIKDDIRKRADKFLGDSELLIIGSVNQAVISFNAYIEKELKSRDVADCVIEAALIPQRKANDLAASIIKELNDLVDKLW